MMTETLLQSDKQIASDLVERMPDTATFDQIREELAIAKALRRGREAIRDGASASHEEAMRRSAPCVAS